MTAAGIPDFSSMEINGETPNDFNSAGLCPTGPLFSTTFPLKWMHVLSHNAENQAIITQPSPITQRLAIRHRQGNTSTEVIPTVLYSAT